MKTKLIALLIALCLLAGMATFALADVLEFESPEGGEGEAPAAELDEAFILDEIPEVPSDGLDIVTPEDNGTFGIEMPVDLASPADANAAQASEAEEPDDPCPDGEHEYELVDFDHYECRLCGQTLPFTKANLTIEYTGPTLSKVYDKTNYVQYSKTDPETGEKSTVWLMSDKLSTAMFKVNTVTDSVTGKKYDGIRLAGLAWADPNHTGLPGADAGSYKLLMRLRLEGDDLGYYDLTESNGNYYCPSVVEIPAKITRRTVTVMPKDMTYTMTSGSTVTYLISKTYGEEDKFIPFFPQGLLSLTTAEKEAGKKLYTGSLGRKAGENAGKYRINLGTLDFGNDNYKVKLEKAYFTINRKPLADPDIGVTSISDRSYTGKPIEPSVGIRFGERKLKKNTDFTLSYRNNKAIGTATVTVTGKGNYKGSIKVTFRIVPKGTTISKLAAGAKQFTVRWKKRSGVTGYQINYGLKKKAASTLKKTVKGAGKTKVTLKGLNANKTYYVRIRTYKTVKGKAYCSAWSAWKKVRTK